ncbi:hypothetical protein B0H13DRAFT_2281654 [Mycena leptocephala]|nr:hypothetical protein B0H13DRAFT_2281654 [Mycena leptocephala]
MGKVGPKANANKATSSSTKKPVKPSQSPSHLAFALIQIIPAATRSDDALTLNKFFDPKTAAEKKAALEAKQHQKAEARERNANPKTAPAVAGQATPFFIGYAWSPVLLPKMGGKGPTVVPGPRQRRIRRKTTLRLYRVAGYDASGLQRMEPAHSLKFVVDPIRKQ